ncbi:hypothetical protein HKCCE4037_11560 [Rhodobacterales bacterium HKCCE4037]|nr:hypothetical protein [Rhodobacterales bacterium HKCCE4037]
MSLLRPFALTLALLAPLPALADAHAAGTVMIDGTLQYASVGQSVFITAGENGAPEEIEIGMILVLVDDEDPNLTFTGEVATEVTDNGTSTGRWTVLLTE